MLLWSLCSHVISWQLQLAGRWAAAGWQRGEIRSCAAYSCVANASFRKLVCWQLAFELAEELREVVLSWPAFDRDTLGLQLLRACDSVAANIAEASGRWYANDKRRILYIARGSPTETEHWMLTAQRRDLIDDRFDGRVAEMARTLNG